MNRRQVVKPSGRAEEAVRRLARDAAKKDGWMRPCFDGRSGRARNWSDFQDAHRETWEETEHFHHYYADPMWSVCDEQQRRIERVLGGKITEDERLSLFFDLKDIFWEVWEEKVRLVARYNERKFDEEGRSP